MNRPASHGVSRASRPRVGAVASRSASTGATRVARRAGASAPASVTSVPTSRQTTIVRACEHEVGRRQVDPERLEQLVDRRTRSRARRRSRAPSRAMPMVSASSSTESSTWRRVAPSVRSSASSRARWATVIENVLKIRNAPTSTAMNANASRPVVRNQSPSRMSSPALSASCAAVRTCAVGGRIEATWRWSVGVGHARLGRDEREVDLVALVEQRLRRGEVEHDDRRAAEPGRPTRASPGRRARTASSDRRRRRSRVSPTSKPSLSAVETSSATSSGPRGARPSGIPMAANGFGM